MSVSVRHLSLHGLPAVQFTLTQFDVDRSHPRPEHLAMLDRCIERLPVRSATITADLSTQLGAARAAVLRHHLIFTRKVNQVVVTEGIAGQTGARVVFHARSQSERDQIRRRGDWGYASIRRSERDRWLPVRRRRRGQPGDQTASAMVTGPGHGTR